MANRTRNIPIQFFVTSEEKKMIRKKMILSKTANMGACLRKRASDGIIVNTDTTYIEKQFFEMHKIGVNVNQLANRAILNLSFFITFYNNYIILRTITFIV